MISHRLESEEAYGITSNAWEVLIEEATRLLLESEAVYLVELTNDLLIPEMQMRHNAELTPEICIPQFGGSLFLTLSAPGEEDLTMRRLLLLIFTALPERHRAQVRVRSDAAGDELWTRLRSELPFDIHIEAT